MSVARTDKVSAAKNNQEKKRGAQSKRRLGCGNCQKSKTGVCKTHATMQRADDFLRWGEASSPANIEVEGLSESAALADLAGAVKVAGLSESAALADRVGAVEVAGLSESAALADLTEATVDTTAVPTVSVDPGFLELLRQVEEETANERICSSCNLPSARQCDTCHQEYCRKHKRTHIGCKGKLHKYKILPRRRPEGASSSSSSSSSDDEAEMIFGKLLLYILIYWL